MLEYRYYTVCKKTKKANNLSARKRFSGSFFLSIRLICEKMRYQLLVETTKFEITSMIVVLSYKFIIIHCVTLETQQIT
jgi:hypothetical protein